MLNLKEESRIKGNGPEGLEEVMTGITRQTKETKTFFQNELELWCVPVGQKSKDHVVRVVNILTDEEDTVRVPYRDKELVKEIMEHGIYAKVGNELIPMGYYAVTCLLADAGAKCRMTESHSGPVMELVLNFLQRLNYAKEMRISEDGEYEILRVPGKHDIPQQRKFILRSDEDGNKKIVAMTSGQYKLIPETTSIDLIKRFNDYCADEDQQLKIVWWEATHFRTVVQTHLPPPPVDYAEFYKLPKHTEFEMGVRITNSCAKMDAFKVFPTISIGKAKDLPMYKKAEEGDLKDANVVLAKEIKRIHMGENEVNVVVLADKLHEQLGHVNYAEYPQRLAKFATRTQNVYVDDVLEAAFRAMKLGATTGSSISLHKQDMIKDEIRKNLGGIKELPIFLVIMQIIEDCGQANYTFLSETQKDLLRQCVLRVVFDDYEEC